MTVLHEAFGLDAGGRHGPAVAMVRRRSRQVERGEAQAAFLVEPLEVAEVARLALAGKTLPQKSTDFYPKLASGVTIYHARDQLGPRAFAEFGIDAGLQLDLAAEQPQQVGQAVEVADYVGLHLDALFAEADGEALGAAADGAGDVVGGGGGVLAGDRPVGENAGEASMRWTSAVRASTSASGIWARPSDSRAGSPWRSRR